MKCKIISNPKDIPTFEDFEKIEEFEYNSVFKLLERGYQAPGNSCWILNCENNKLYVIENNICWELGIIKNTATENRKIKEMTNKKYTAKLKVNNDRIIEVEGLSGPFSCQFIGCTSPISQSEDLETDENYCCDECLLKNQTDADDQEITKDLMLDEVVSSQHREIERLTEIIQDLVTTNLKLVEMLGKK